MPDSSHCPCSHCICCFVFVLFCFITSATGSDLLSLCMCVNMSAILWQILYNQQSVEVQGNLRRKLITHLQPDTEYSFVLMNRGSSAGGLQQQVSIRTAPDLLDKKPSRSAHDSAVGGRVSLTLPTVTANTAALVRSVPYTHTHTDTWTSSVQTVTYFFINALHVALFQMI